MSLDHAGSLPLVADKALRGLQRDLGDDGRAGLLFVKSFMSMWPDRYKRLSEAVRGRHEVASMDAVLSLRTSSKMLGAERLAALADELEGELRRGNHAIATDILVDIRICGEATMELLEAHYPAAGARQ
ncbi:Hpt domain-containing protein [Arthrobacter monumenti]